ncbi:MAG: class I SAM-dependent methyltransferase [Mycobacterium sp.]
MHRQRQRADSFGGAARAYDTHRPRYPEAMFDDLLGGRAARVLDVGAGTGIASQQLVDRGAEVLALEPDSRMAELARGRGLAVEVATFEDWDDAGRGFDVILFAQSFHWVDPEVALPKIRRLLRSDGGGGILALAWNRLFPVVPSRTDFAAVYRDFIDGASPLVTAAPTGGTGSGMDSDGVAADIQRAGFVVDSRTYARGEQYSPERWLDLVFTYSNHLVLEPERARELRSRLGELIGEDGVQVGGDTLLITCRPA